MFDMMREPLIPIECDGDQRAVALPGLFSALQHDEVAGFAGLTAHQAQAWYQFLAQLGALAMHQRGLVEAPADSDVWLDLLTDLASEHAETAWSLTVDDPGCPALLQPPTEEIGGFRPAAETPDELDVLVTAKNHDRKCAVAIEGSPHLWLYALVTLQTAQGYSGRGNPGIARMNGGMSSRVLVDRRPSRRWGPRIVRAIHMLLERRPDILRRTSDAVYRAAGGLALTWLRPWDTDVPLEMSELDPFFIEVCRRVRLRGAPDGQIMALARPSARPRTQSAALKGNLADPWVPIKMGKDEPTALTVSSSGFDYRLARQILFDRAAFREPLALRELPGERGHDSEIHMVVLVRGQGKTEGLHERIIPLPHSVAPQMPFDEADVDGEENTLAELSERMVDAAGEARKVLRQSILVYLHGPDNPKFNKPDAAAAITRYDRAIDEQYFGYLFGAVAAGAEEANRRWQELLVKEAKELARGVWATMAAPSARREKARAAAESVLFGGLRKRLPDAHQQPKEVAE